MTTKNFKDFFLSMSADERESYAKSASTSTGYIRTQLIGRRRTPRPSLMRNLANASNGQLTINDLTSFFYHQPVQPTSEATDHQ